MLRLRNVLPYIASALFLAPLSAQAAPLTVVNVGAPAVNCVFNTTCTVVVTDSIGNFTPPLDIGNARLQSRTYPGTAPAPAGGKFAYEYRIDMTQVKGVGGSVCVNKMDINFGPVVKEPYPPGALKDIFVVTSGGLGSVGVSSATQVGGTITFNFGTSGVCPGETSFFFGLTSADTMPSTGVAKLYYSNGGSAFVDARMP